MILHFRPGQNQERTREPALLIKLNKNNNSYFLSKDHVS